MGTCAQASVSPVHNYSRNPLSARDHTATPSCWRRVDGLEVIIQQWRTRENLIHALGLTSNLGMSKAGALGASGILKSIFGASGSFGASGILKDGASGACAHIDR